MSLASGLDPFISPSTGRLSKGATLMASRSRIAMVILFALVSTATVAPAARAGDNGGHVLPPTANFRGWSLDDMAQAVAIFSITGNDPAFEPDTPFQIIYRRPGNT